MRSATDPCAVHSNQWRSPRSASRAGQKTILQRQLSNLRMQCLHIDDRFGLRLRGLAKHLGCALQELIAPLLDLVGVGVEILNQLDQDILTLDRSHCNFRSECRTVVPVRSSPRIQQSCRCCAENPPIPVVQLSGTASAQSYPRSLSMPGVRKTGGQVDRPPCPDRSDSLTEPRSLVAPGPSHPPRRQARSWCRYR